MYSGCATWQTEGPIGLTTVESGSFQTICIASPIASLSEQMGETYVNVNPSGYPGGR